MTTEKTQRLLASLEQAVLGVQDSDGFKAYLRMTAKFHSYSFGNVLLIASQQPGATRVAGYRTWHAFGRYVRRGEKGIAIVVPYRTMRNNDAGETEERVRFGTGYVFDISQTEGQDLPNVRCPLLSGDSARDLYEALACLAASKGFVLDRAPRPDEPAAGFWQPATRTIWISPELSTDQAAKTLAHELAHAFDPEIGDYGACRDEREAVAEAAAFVVCERFGLDTSERSVPYIAGWSKDIETLKRALAKVQTIAHQILETLDATQAQAAA
ncbi:MAG: ArdC-like ssDNA-binding domain-containing protein [Dehalococcoidia bacterium]